MDLAWLVLVLLSVAMFAAVVATLARAGRGSARRGARVAWEPGGEDWLTVEEVARLLETEPHEILDLVDRGAIPFFVDPRPNLPERAAYWFRRDEIDAWVVG